MQEFKLTLMRKAKMISQLKYPQRNNRESILKYLKHIKKEEKSSERNDLQVLKSLANFQYQHKQFLENTYFLSFAVMKALCKKFEFFPEEKETFDNIIEMHYKFYTKEGAFQKAQQIRMAFRKKTFSKQTFINNLLISLYNWAKNKLDKFLSQQISSIKKDLLNDMLDSPQKFVQSHEKLQNTSPLKDSMFKGTLMNISYSQKLQKYEKSSKKQNLKIVINGNRHLLQQQNQYFDISQFLNRQITQEAQQCIQQTFQRIQTSFQHERSTQLAPGNYLLKQRSRSYNKYNGDKNFNLQNLNKQIFYGTYWKEINQLYRNLNVIDDLDLYYLKTFKKQKEQRKEQLAKNRMDEIVDFMIKNMPTIKKSIQAYESNYSKYCPSEIRQFHTASSKILLQEGKKKVIKNICNKKIEKTQTQQKQEICESLKSVENNLPIQYPQKINRKSVLLHSRQRKKSLNDGILSKSTQQKPQIQIIFPIAYNPENLHSMAEFQAQKALAIHQKYQKFIVNGARPNKGLVRYKKMVKEREKNISDGNNFMKDRIGDYQNLLIQNRRQHEYQVANIRQILRRREKEKHFAEKIPIFATKNKEDQIIENIMIHIKGIDTKDANGFTPTKADKFEVFLSNIKNTESAPLGLKIKSRSFNLKSNESHRLQNSSEYRALKEDLLPKI